MMKQIVILFSLYPLYKREREWYNGVGDER